MNLFEGRLAKMTDEDNQKLMALINDPKVIAAAKKRVAENWGFHDPFKEWKEPSLSTQMMLGTKILNPMEIVKMDSTSTVSKRPLVIYHGNCADGFSAAWCFHHHSPGTYDFHAGKYQEDPLTLLDLAGRDVYLVDFSYKREVIIKMLAEVRSITLIDHHKTALEDLAGLENIYSHFKTYTDLNRSGAMLAWDYLFNVRGHGVPWINPPILLEHIQDRDLWKFKLGGTRAIQVAAMAYDMTFENWDKIMCPGDRAGQVVGRTELWKEGEAILRKYDKDLKTIVESTLRWLFIEDTLFPVANVPYFMASDAGQLIYSTAIHPSSGERVKFSATYYDTAGERCFSLRSADDGPDISEIAKKFGGGGHAHAAGFKVDRSHHLAMD